MLHKNIKLGVFLAIGESFRDFKEKGQDELIINNNLLAYKKVFNTVTVFSYEHESPKLLPGVSVVPNKWKLHRYLYSILIPILHKKKIKKCNIFRGLQITGGIPCFFLKIFGGKIIVNYGYDYAQFSIIEKKYIQAIFYRILDFLILPFVNGVIVPTKEIEKHVRKFANKEKIITIPNGVDVNLFSPKIKTKKKYDLLFVGRLEKQKNLFFLIDVVKYSQKKYHVVFIGGGSLKNELKNYAKKRNVKLTIIDSVPHSSLPKYLNEARVFVFPSLAEGHPKALLEALSCGLPVIASNIPGVKDIIRNKETGILVQLNNMKQWIKAIRFIEENKKNVKKISEHARLHIEKNFNVKVLLKKEILFLKRFAK